MSNLTKTLFFTLTCKNYPMKSNWWTLDLCLAASARKYFKVFMEAVDDQVSQTIDLFLKSPLTTILNFNLPWLPSDWILGLYISMHGVTGSPSFWSSIRKIWLLIRLLISLRVAFSHVYLMSNLTKTLFFTLTCKNYPMKSNLWTLDLCLAASARKYFKVFMEAVDDQVSQTIDLFLKSPLTTILSFNLSRLPSYWIFVLYTSMHGVTGSPSFWYPISKVWLLIRIFISLR